MAYAGHIFSSAITGSGEVRWAKLVRVLRVMEAPTGRELTSSQIVLSHSYIVFWIGIPHVSCMWNKLVLIFCNWTCKSSNICFIQSSRGSYVGTSWLNLCMLTMTCFDGSAANWKCPFFRIIILENWRTFTKLLQSSITKTLNDISNVHKNAVFHW